MTAPVKSRRYDASRRQAQARERRARVLDAAWELFQTNGYAATTVGAVASRAAVSEETVYKTFGGKSGLVRELRLRALQGSGTLQAETRSDRLRHHDDPVRIVRGWARLAAEVAPLVCPVLLLVRDAALADPGMRALAAELDDERRVRMAENAVVLHRAGHLRRGLGVERATDILFAASSPEMFELLVLRCGWDLPRYSRHLEDTLRAALLRPRTSTS
ncbi:MAG: TetR/AcrR family transcriptional regulator [Nocardioides sp.]